MNKMNIRKIKKAFDLRMKFCKLAKKVNIVPDSFIVMKVKEEDISKLEKAFGVEIEFGENNGRFNYKDLCIFVDKEN